MSAAIANTDVRAPLRFIVPQETKPYYDSSAATGGEPVIYFETEYRDVDISDIRAKAQEPTLDKEGFCLKHAPTGVANLHDDGVVSAQYEPELCELLKTFTGADRVGVFDYTRRSDDSAGASNADGKRGPASRVHVDYTVASGPKRARDALGERVFEEVIESGGRVMQVNVWRPIRGPVERTPLAVADAKSIAIEELVATDQLFPDRVGEIYHIAYGTGQRWYWASKMRRDEVFLIKGWDSLDDGRAQFTPHGAFVLPGQMQDGPPRESIEARAYLIFNA